MTQKLAIQGGHSSRVVCGEVALVAASSWLQTVSHRVMYNVYWLYRQTSLPYSSLASGFLAQTVTQFIHTPCASPSTMAWDPRSRS